MQGKRKKQAALFDVGNVFDLELDPGSFHAQLALAGPALFPETAFADLYSDRLGRPSVPPSELALLLLLQYHAGVSDQEAVERSAYDLRWCAVLRRPAGKPLCARTTLILFRARLALHEASDRLFDRTLQYARETGLLKAGALRVLLDTKPIVGRGAVEDTYNLLARSMDRLLRALAGAAGQTTATWAAEHELAEYVRRRERSLKGEAVVDWTDAADRRRFLRTVVGAARRLLALAAAQVPQLSGAAARAVQAEVELLTALLTQDVVETPPPSDGSSGSGGGSGGGSDAPQVELRDGTAKDRIPSATDSDQRHGHKSASRKFTGHKGRIAVEPESQLIVDVEVLAGNAGDAAGALAQVERVEERLGQEVAETVGDCAFGGGATRQEFADAGRELRAKVPDTPDRWEIPKQRFTLLWEGEGVTGVSCPGGHTTREYTAKKDGGRVFTFGKECRRCPLRHKCVQSGKTGASRTLQIHPQEALLAAAREYQASPEGQATLRRRVGVEHALARLAALGMGQARYRGRKQTQWQLCMCAAVANFRWTENWRRRQRPAGPSDGPNPPGEGDRQRFWPLQRRCWPPRWHRPLPRYSTWMVPSGTSTWLGRLSAAPF
ncbi:MAG: IS5/IS1182 family transposase [Bacillota bacterium]|nr:MAG: IS5/IS1182 family transposase [Bacillota bacterium]